jgi:hypothetical protein
MKKMGQVRSYRLTVIAEVLEEFKDVMPPDEETST